MMAIEIITVSLMGLGMAGVFLKSVFHFGNKAGELTASIDKLTTAVDKMGDTLADHEIRITKLEVK